MKNRRIKWARWGRRAVFLLTSLIFALAVAVYVAAEWISVTYSVSLDELLFLFASPLKGANMEPVWTCAAEHIPALKLIGLYILIGAVLLFIQNRMSFSICVRGFKRVRCLEIFRFLRRCMSLLCVAAVVCSVVNVDRYFQLWDYIKARASDSTLYEDYYVFPDSVQITGSGKNLICIYMESMETTYASAVVGGAQPEENYIPNLTALAEENVSFSDSNQLGGFRPITGTTWTLGSLFATTSGLPFSFPIEANSMSTRQTFASGVTSLGDILAGKGYQNEFLCGSDANFAGRMDYFTQHGKYKIFDLFSARDAGYVSADYHNGFWGYEDLYLYQIAKDELTSLAQSEQSFNFTMLTVDTHHVDGYVCALCGNAYEATTANVVSCADRQVQEFIDWCREQDFYKDTLIVISGDHPRMDRCLVEGVEYYDRTVYNCFLNCDLQPARTKNREFTAMDLFPTVLAAMGFQVEGDRLGLGVNLFSDQPTLCEALGYSALETQISAHSSFYVRHFA